jgi:hypothetical protein
MLPTNPALLSTPRTAHSWLRKIKVAYIPGSTTPLLEKFIRELLQCFREQEHELQNSPDNSTDVLLTTARFGEPLNWRKALFFTARQRFKLDHLPTVFTVLHATPLDFRKTLDHFARTLANEQPNPADYDFPGLAPQAFHTLHEQGRRGGPILALVRLLQSQAMSIRIVLVVGEDRVEEAYTFDLVGAHPRSEATDPQAFYEDLVLRIVTAVSTYEITDHEVVGEMIPQSVWRSLSSPMAMRSAGQELGRRSFFTEMVRVANLVNVPAIHEAISNQYSEGCFATWDPSLDALITTVTGSARPVEKDKLSDDELAIISGVRSDGRGARVRHVEGKRNDPPSSEAVELMEMDSQLPWINLGGEWDISARVPVARSKLHGHRGVKSFDPQWIEHVFLDTPYYHYPVSCSTEAQARAIQAAFSRSAALSNPGDPRQVVFTVLPGHGIVIVEKWVSGYAPFQAIWEYMDGGILEIDNFVPQGPLVYIPDTQGRMVLHT